MTSEGNGSSFEWPIPGSKSITNRALILAALRDGKTALNGVLHSDDTRHMLNALKDSGINVEVESDTRLIVHGGIKNLKNPGKKLFVGNSGTTVRFLTTFCAFIEGDVTLDGDKHMESRPIKDLIVGLAQSGVEIDCPTGCPPLTVKSSVFQGGVIKMKGDNSSQYFSSVMMCAPLAKQDTTIEVEGTLVSVPYAIMTASMMKSFGADIDIVYEDGEVRRIEIKAKPYSSEDNLFEYGIEADASAATYAFAAAAITGTAVSVKTRVVGESLQGDFAFADILERMGCIVDKQEGVLTVKGPVGKQLIGVEEDMFNISDTVMTLAAIAPLAIGNTKIVNIANIRIKETDRLQATVTELKRIGQEVVNGEDWFEITPKPVESASIECYSDHRIAMSFGILSLVAPGVTISDKACVSKTYPTFWEHLQLFKDFLATKST